MYPKESADEEGPPDAGLSIEENRSGRKYDTNRLVGYLLQIIGEYASPGACGRHFGRRREFCRHVHEG